MRSTPPIMRRIAMNFLNTWNLEISSSTNFGYNKVKEIPKINTNINWMLARAEIRVTLGATEMI